MFCHVPYLCSGSSEPARDKHIILLCAFSLPCVCSPSTRQKGILPYVLFLSCARMEADDKQSRVLDIVATARPGILIHGPYSAGHIINYKHYKFMLSLFYLELTNAAYISL